VEDVSIGDDPAFSSAPFLRSKSVRVGADLMPLIFSKALHVRSVEIEAPQIVLLHSPAGAWSFSSLRALSPGAREAGVAKFRSTGGQLTVGTPGSRGKVRVYSDVNIDATDLSYRAPFPFRLRAKTPGGGTIAIDGRAGPIDATDVAKTPVQGTAKATHFDLGATGFPGPASGINGLSELTAAFHSDGRHARVTGTARTTRLQLVRGSSSARVPIDFDIDSDYDLETERGVLKPGNMHLGKALARLSGTYDLKGEIPIVRMTLSGRQMSVPAVEAALPAIGIVLPPGAALTSGTLSTDLIIAGPVDHLVTTGPADVSNARVAGFDLASKMGSLAPFGSVPKSGDTVIQTLKAGLRIAADGIQAHDIVVIVPSIGSMTGSGTIAPSGVIHFAMLGRLSASNAGNIVNDIMSRATGIGLPGSNATRFRIEGTLTNPVFVPEVPAPVPSFAKPSGVFKSTTGLLEKLLGGKR
jgi:AsmA protein